MEECIRDIMMNGIPSTFCDTVAMQSLFTLEQKGWTKKVIWKQSTVLDASIGVFADEDIQKGETTMRYINKKNLIILKSAEDLPPLTKNTIEYLQNFIFQIEDVCGFTIPGAGINHDGARANHQLVKISDNEVVGMAIKDVQKGEELVCDYAHFGLPPKWLIDYAWEHDIWKSLVFKGYN